ncbi:MAG: hypothetical protein MJ051_05555 [Akkermansia sp.]|nr:hypothetical protein [Akkermansia sp.]
MTNTFSLIAALGLSALTGWEGTTSGKPFSWECVAPKHRLEQGLNITRVITLREEAARLPEVSVGDLEEVWDWHPAGRTASAHARHSGGGSYPDGADKQEVDGRDEPRGGTFSHRTSEKSPTLSAEGTHQPNGGNQESESSRSGHAWHDGHGNYPKGANERVVTGGDMSRGETSSRGTSATKPTEYAEGTRRYSSHSRYSRANGGGGVSSSRQRDDIGGIGFYIFLCLLLYGVPFSIPLYLKLSEEGPEHLFHWGFRLGWLSLSQYALQKSDRIHVDSVFLQAVTAGKTEWVDLLLAADWEGKSSSKIALLFIEGLIQQPHLSTDIFQHISRYLSGPCGVDLNDRLSLSSCPRGATDSDSPSDEKMQWPLLDLERKEEEVQQTWGKEKRITWSTQPLMMIVCAMHRRDLAELLLQEGLCSNIALLYQSAMQRGEEREAERLLAYGGSCKVALSDAVRYGVSLPVLLRILSRYLRQGGSIYADLSYNGGGSILHQALFWQRDDVVEYLLDAYTDRERFERGVQQSLLSLAAAKNSPHLGRIADLPPNWLRMLKDIDQVAESEIWDKLRALLNETTYSEAARYINEKDENGNTPLGRMVWAWFCETKHLHRKQYVTYQKGETYQRIHILLRLGADPNCGFREPLSGEWHSLVFYAAIMGNAHLVDLLASCGASVWEASQNKALIRTVGIKPLLNQWYKTPKRG